MTALTFDDVSIPIGAYWSSSFHRWKGALADASPIETAAECGLAAARRDAVTLDAVEQLHLGITVPSPAIFFGAPRLASLMGLPRDVTGPTISQACATSAAVLASAAAAIELGDAGCVLAVCADRTSNGPRLYYPDKSGPAARGISEDWVWDNFTDPDHGHLMIESAENIAAAGAYDRAEQDAMCVLRHEQYRDALSSDRAFQRSYMIDPQAAAGLSGDQGVRSVDPETIATRSPVVEAGTVTSMTQTYPADGNAGLLLMHRTSGPGAQMLAHATARVAPGRMGEATVPAAAAALNASGLAVGDMAAVKTHNPFAVNDVYFCDRLGLASDAVNRYGSSLVWGHPQAPTGLRSIIELIEELCIRGGGYGLFSGCAAGDTAAAVIVRVDD